MYSILLVEDNPEIQELNKNLLEQVSGYTVRLAVNLSEARQAISEFALDMIVLDIMLPDGNGLDFLAELRSGGNNIPVLLLTALGTAKEKVAGLRTGGDDYLAKPYDYDELLARIESLLRRVRRDVLTCGGITLNLITRQLLLNGEGVRLPQIEYSMFELFMKNENKIVTAEELYEGAWKQQLNNDTVALQNQIYKTRKRLEGSGYSITTKRGKGYVFERD